MKTASQNPKSEIRFVKEIRSPKSERGIGRHSGGSAFSFRDSFGFRRSVFGILLPLIVSVFSLQPSAFAQSYCIDWYKIAGGGGTSIGGVYAVSGTIGQHDAGGPMTGGNYSLTGGFWSFISVLQTAGAPALHISHSGNAVTVYWQDVSGWSLQQNADLANQSGWSVNTGWATSNGTNSITLDNPGGNLFFRLTK